MSGVSGILVVFNRPNPPKFCTLSMYVPGVIVFPEGVGKVLRRGAMTASNWSAGAYHPPVKPKLTLPLVEPIERTISAAISCGISVLAKFWNCSVALAASAGLRSQLYLKTVADAGAGKVST